MTPIFKSNGIYLGFIQNNYVFSRDGLYWGWVENNQFVWDKSGQYKGQLTLINDRHYILRNMYSITPLPKMPLTAPVTPALPAPQANILPIQLRIGFQDAF